MQIVDVLMEANDEEVDDVDPSVTLLMLCLCYILA